MSDTVRLGMIGCGLISHAHGRAARKSSDAIQFLSCASRDAKRAEDWAKTYGCTRVCTDFRDLLNPDEIDGLVIATWPADHKKHIEASVEAGVKFILCEKPLTVTANDAIALMVLCEQAGVTLVEGMMYRFHPAIEQFRARITDGAVGNIDAIAADFSMYRNNQITASGNDWRSRQDAGGGVIHDFACYPIDALTLIAQDLPMQVMASGLRVNEAGVPTRLSGTVEFRNGILGLLWSSFGASFSQTLRVSGSQGHLTMPIAWSIRDEAVIVHATSGQFLELHTTETRIPQPAVHDGRLIDFPVFQLQLERFAANIRGEASPGVFLCESVINAIVRDALQESLELERTVPCRIPADVEVAYRQLRASKTEERRL